MFFGVIDDNSARRESHVQGPNAFLALKRATFSIPSTPVLYYWYLRSSTIYFKIVLQEFDAVLDTYRTVGKIIPDPETFTLNKKYLNNFLITFVVHKYGT